MARLLRGNRHSGTAEQNYKLAAAVTRHRKATQCFEQFEKLKAAEESERDIITRLVGKIA